MYLHRYFGDRCHDLGRYQTFITITKRKRERKFLQKNTENMGWKASMIVVNSDNEVDKNDLLESLECYELEKIDDQYLDSIMNPDDGEIYIGKYNGNTILCVQDLPLTFMDENISRTESILSKYFPDTEIASFVLHSVVNLWGYSISKNGEKMRVRAGSAEGGQIVEHGSPLKEEEALFSQSRTNESGERIFVFDDMPEDQFQDDQVGENFVFDLSVRYFGESLDASDKLLFETPFEGYRFSKSKPVKEEPVQEVRAVKKEEPKRPWWKFW